MMVLILEKTRNIQSLFPLKDKRSCKLCVIYKEDCSYGSCCIGETKQAQSTTVLHGIYFRCSKKKLRPGRIYKHQTMLYGNLILTHYVPANTKWSNALNKSSPVANK